MQETVSAASHAAWDAIETSRDAKLYEKFLAQHANSALAAEAQARLEHLAAYDGLHAQIKELNELAFAAKEAASCLIDDEDGADEWDRSELVDARIDDLARSAVAMLEEQFFSRPRFEALDKLAAQPAGANGEARHVSRTTREAANYVFESMINSRRRGEGDD